MKSIKDTFLYNLKIEIVTVMVLLILGIWKKYFPLKNSPNIELLSYFTQERLNGIATFFAITIGIYIAVITVLATSEISISREMLKRNLDKPLIDIIIAGIVEDLTTVGLAIFIPLNVSIGYVLMIFLFISVISFAKFIVLLVVIFKANMNQMAKAIDEEETYKDSILTYLDTISRNQNYKNEK